MVRPRNEEMKEGRRFFVDNIGENAAIEGDEFLHAKNVLRLGVGDEVILLDGSGDEYGGIITAVGKRDMSVHVISKNAGEREAPVPVKVIFGYIKNADKNEFVVQKCAELGVKEIAVFSSEYSSAYMNENKLERLNKVSREAAKQCLRSAAPPVKYYPDLLSALKSAEGYENKLFACEFAEKSDIDISGLRSSAAIVVGSEGGFSVKEFDMAIEMGFKGIFLGKRILRAETAAVALTSIVSFAVGNLR